MAKIINVTVHPNSKKNEINCIDENSNTYKVNIKEKAKNNKANIELVKLIKKHFNKDVKIIKGLKNNKKILRVE